MVKAIVVGAAGRMGKALITVLLQDTRVCLAGACEIKGHPDVGRDAGEAAGQKKCGIIIADDLAGVVNQGDVIIDFTSPAGTRAHVNLACRHAKNMVIGTTGLNAEAMEKIKVAGKKIAIVQSGNMSVGINLLLHLVATAAQTLGDGYDVEIIEAHHRFKKDAPSGTAGMLAQAAAKALHRDLRTVGTYGRKGITAERAAKEIGIHAVRAGDIIGEHTVLFGTLGERIELVHKAHSREIFAQGAVRAAAFLAGKQRGFFTMQDVLDLK